MKTVVFTRSSNIYDDSRATKEIEALLDMGFRVFVLGWNRNGNAEEQCASTFNQYSDRLKFSFYNGETGSNKIWKLLARFEWNRWLKDQLRKSGKIDFIHSCDFDTGNAVRQFAVRKHIRYLYDIYDYYVDAHPVPGVLKRYIEKQEIAVINQAELCIICTEERKEQIQNANPQKLLVIHNSPDVEVCQNTEERYDYTYCGSLFGGRLIGEILRDYPDHNHLKFAYAGYGQFAEDCRALQEINQCFSFLESIPYSQVLEIESQSKVISAIYDPSIRNHRLCAPNKFYEALALGKPLVVCRGTGIDKVVEKNNLGIVIDYAADDFYKAVETLCADAELRKEMGKRARTLYENEFRWSVMKQKLMDAYGSCILGGGE